MCVIRKYSNSKYYLKLCLRSPRAEMLLKRGLRNWWNFVGVRGGRRVEIDWRSVYSCVELVFYCTITSLSFQYCKSCCGRVFFNEFAFVGTCTEFVFSRGFILPTQWQCWRLQHVVDKSTGFTLVTINSTLKFINLCWVYTFEFIAFFFHV